MPDIAFHDDELALEPFDCRCGRRHELPIRRILVRPRAIDEVASIVGELGTGTRVTLVADGNTYRIAGRAVEDQLRRARYRVTLCLFDTTQPVKPDETAVGDLMLTMGTETDLLVVCGSGSLTDLTRFVAARTATPFVSVATAPSMDGYSGSGAPMTHHGHKRTIIATNAKAVIADTEILTAAPYDMIASGFSDTIGKLTSRVDWKLSAIVRNEYYCPVFAAAVDAAVGQTVAAARAIRSRDADAIRTLGEALMISGIAMLLVGNSRPASGSEHSLSHYWEMCAGIGRRRPFFHGTKVGVATGVAAAFNERFFARDPAALDIERVVASAEPVDAIEDRLRGGLGPVAEGVIAEVVRPEYVDGTRRMNAVAEVVERWDEIAALAALSPGRDEIVRIQEAVGAPWHPSEIDVDRDYLRETLLNAKEVRSRYTVLRAAEHLGWLEEIADEVVALYYD